MGILNDLINKYKKYANSPFNAMLVFTRELPASKYSILVYKIYKSSGNLSKPMVWIAKQNGLFNFNKQGTVFVKEKFDINELLNKGKLLIALFDTPSFFNLFDEDPDEKAIDVIEFYKKKEVKVTALIEAEPKVKKQQVKKIGLKFTGDVTKLANDIADLIKPYSKVKVITGSIRRKKPDPRDIDIVVIPKDIKKFQNFVYTLGDKISGGDKKIVINVEGINVEFYIAKMEYLGAMMLYTTGPGGYGIGLRNIAKKKGWKLSQYGLFDENGRLIAAKTETDIYEAIGKSYKKPELRGK